MLRSLQVLNITKQQWLWILPTSLGIATCEVYVISLIADSHLPKLGLIVAAGVGGTVGCFGAIWISQKFGGKRED